MTNYPDDHDRRLDANLRAIAPMLPLPAEPSTEQTAGWKRTEAPSVVGRIGRRTQRWLAAAALLVAAGAGVTALFFANSPGSVVHAGTIMDRLQHSKFNGMRLLMNDVRVQGVKINGELRMIFGAPLDLERILQDDDHEEAPDIRELHAKIKVDASAMIPMLGAMTTEIASTHQSTWMHVQLSGLLGRFIPLPAPAPAGVDAPPRSGDADVLIDLGEGGFMKTMLDLAGIAEARGEPVPKFDPPPKNPNKPAAGSGASGNAMQDIFKTLLLGQAGPGEMGEIQTLMQKAEASSTIEILGGGRYLLSTRIDGLDDGADKPGRRQMKVSYLQNSGIEWVEFVDIGPTQGTIRIEFINGPLDPTLLDKTRVIVPGKTKVMDKNALLKSVGGGF